MRILSAVLFVAAAVLAGIAYRADAMLQGYRAPSGPPSAYRLIPLRWMDPALYTAPGERYRLTAMRATQTMVVCFLGGMLAFGLGL